MIVEQLFNNTIIMQPSPFVKGEIEKNVRMYGLFPHGRTDV